MCVNCSTCWFMTCLHWFHCQWHRKMYGFYLPHWLSGTLEIAAQASHQGHGLLWKTMWVRLWLLNRKNHSKNSKVRGRLHTTSRTFLHVCHKSMVVGCSLLLTSHSRSQCVQSFCAVVNNDFTVGTPMLLHLKVYSAQHVSKNAPHSCHVAPLC